MNQHVDRHDLAGTTAHVKTSIPLFHQENEPDTPVPFLVEDWWDRLAGRSWMESVENAACLSYAIRSGACKLPLDNEVVYGHTEDGLGHLVHVTEIHEVLT